LVKQKKELEAKSKQNKQQRDNYATTVKNYDQFQKKTDRDSIDAVNKQISQPSQVTQPIQAT
jgi:ribosomal protein S25